MLGGFRFDIKTGNLYHLMGARAFPNPFRSGTGITYNVALGTGISIYDMQGKLVRRLADRTEGPGLFELVWDGRSDGGTRVSSGFYLLQLQAGPEARIQKVVLTR